MPVVRAVELSCAVGLAGARVAETFAELAHDYVERHAKRQRSADRREVEGV
jgi:hypothetical protein